MNDELAARREALPSARLSVQMYDHMLRPHRERMLDLMAAVKHLLQLERRRAITPNEVLNGFCAAIEVNIEDVDARMAQLFNQEARNG